MGRGGTRLGTLDGVQQCTLWIRVGGAGSECQMGTFRPWTKGDRMNACFISYATLSPYLRGKILSDLILVAFGNL